MEGSTLYLELRSIVREYGPAAVYEILDVVCSGIDDVESTCLICQSQSQSSYSWYCPEHGYMHLEDLGA